MDFGCQCICDYDYDPPDVYRQKMVKARRAHTCCECKEEIKPGEMYENATGLWDGCWETFKTCELCIRIRSDVCCNGWLFGQLREEIWGAYRFDYVTGETIEDQRGEEEGEDEDPVQEP